MVRVLFPLDGSPEGYDAFERAVGILRGTSFEGTVFVVQSKGFADAPEDVVRQFSEDELDRVFPDEESCRVVFQETRRRAGKGVRLAFKTVVGTTAAEILKEAAGHDLLVMRAPPRTRRLLGRRGGLAIAEKAPCHVLLVRPQK